MPGFNHLDLLGLSIIINMMNLLRAPVFIFLCFAINGPLIFAQRTALVSSMDDSKLAAQVLLAGIEGRQSLTPAMRSLLERIPAGGIMLFRYNLDSSKAQAKVFLSEVSSLVAAGAGIPPFMAVDHEGGLVNRFGSVAERLPSAYSFFELARRDGREAALEKAETLYRRSAVEIKELGINMVLGPVAEILNDDNRLFLETRSYGPEKAFTLAAASVYIKCMDKAGIASVVKHFPGSGQGDPHRVVSVINADKEALAEMAAPFAGIISSLNPPAMMISHVMVPAIDGKKNASLSRPVIEGWLRGELGFKGIVLADDYSMGAVKTSGLGAAAAAVEALNAGVDMIMVWPQNMAAVHEAILKALGEGRLSRGRLLEAAERIIAGKQRYGIIALSK